MKGILKYSNDITNCETIISQPEPPMPLMRALSILSDFHTRHDAESGFVVEMVPTPLSMLPHGYIEAWRAVRHAIGEKTEPEE